MIAPNSEHGPFVETRYVSTAQVAHALGVSVTTVKRWVDDNVLPAHRTVGGHRKLLMTEVLRLVRGGNLPQADLSRLMPQGPAGDTDPDAVLRQMRDAVAATDVDLIGSIIHGAYQSGTPVETLADRVIAPTLFAAGREWSAAKMDVLQEHRVTQACVAACYELGALLKTNTDKGRPVAVGGAPEHDHALLPSLLAKLTLLDAGWDAIYLGPHTPMAALVSAVDRLAPQLIWLTVTHLEHPEQFLAEYGELYRACDARGVAVVVGGRGLTDPVRVRMPYTAFGDGMTQLGAFARSLYRRPQRPKRGRPPGTHRDPTPTHAEEASARDTVAEG